VADFTLRPGAALVAGASGGLGSAIARLLAERGADVALGYRASRDAAGKLAGELPGKARAVHLDLADPTATAEAVNGIAQEYGGIHTLVYAAGPHVPMIHLSRVTPAQFREQLESDAVAFFNLLSPTLAHLRRCRGNVVAVTTAATRRFPVRDGLSAGPKGAVEAVVRGIAAEEGRYGVRANCVGPGMLTDGMAERLISSGDLDERALAVAQANIPLRRFGTAQDIAEAVCFLASDRAAFITAQHLAVDGGYTA
jgi:NAD(P)-dependent dehydrogenase (short-subunit alcohol dehydrogenase family)